MRTNFSAEVKKALDFYILNHTIITHNPTELLLNTLTNLEGAKLGISV